MKMSDSGLFATTQKRLIRSDYFLQMVSRNTNAESVFTEGIMVEGFMIDESHKWTVMWQWKKFHLRYQYFFFAIRNKFHQNIWPD